MDDVIQKLQETKTLYRNTIKCFKANDPEYIHYLNACINSSHSVADVVKKTGRNINRKKFDAWYQQEESKVFDEQDADFGLLRNVTDHQKPINSKQRIFSGTVGETNKKFQNVRVRIDLQALIAEAVSKSNGKTISVPVSPIDEDIVIEEFDNKKQKIVRKEHFIKSLGLYIRKLEILVSDFSNFTEEYNSNKQ